MIMLQEEFQLALFRTPYGENLFLDRFVHALNVFHPYASADDKIVVIAFRLYDLRQTGFIEREEVKQMVIAIMMESDLKLSNDLLESIIDNVSTTQLCKFGCCFTGW
ncbi:unnamed protein product [Prunus armeniaca]|uniref:Calcineurin B-like protein n=1 Tax=Prunus armeniaca TaxID=36596 RepID=A0A6J5YB11_PRUAR|nr:unnamed protein product [Prunus armeniaca]